MIKRILMALAGMLLAGCVSMSAHADGFAVVAIFRVANGKIVAHWDVFSSVPEKSANENGMV